MKKIVFFIGIVLLLITGCSKSYYCDSGDTLKGSTCITERTTPAQIEYYCTVSQYYLEGTRCVRDFGMAGKLYLNTSQRYYCTSGYLSGTQCIIESTYNAYER